jgi:hypothetical protein
MKVYKKRPTTKQNTDKRKEKGQNLSSLGLLTFVVLLYVDVDVAIVTILFLCSKKWLFSYVPPCKKKFRKFKGLKPSLTLVLFFSSSSF